MSELSIPDGLVAVTLPGGEVVRVDPLRAAWFETNASKPAPPVVVPVAKPAPAAIPPAPAEVPPASEEPVPEKEAQ